MTAKLFALVTTSFLSAVAGCTSLAYSADVVGPAGCTVAGLVQAGGGLSAEHFSSNLVPPKDPATWKMAFGEAALNYSCKDWTAQLDGAYYGHWATENTPAYHLTNGNGHVGGAAFWRNADRGELGVAASRVFQANSITRNGAPVLADVSGGLWRLGAFGEYYGGDLFTVGAGASYINGGAAYNTRLPETADHRGFEADLYAKLYPSDNFGLTIRGDVLSSKIELPFSPDTTWNGFAISGEAEYLIPNSSISLFASALFAKRKLEDITGYYSFEDKQGLVGVRFAFGGAAPLSLRNRDRHGAYDNTSVFDEKLPNLDAELINELAAP